MLFSVHVCYTNEPAEILVLIAYAQKPSLNAHMLTYPAGFGLNHRLVPYFMHTGNEYSGDSALLCRLT